LIVDYFFEGLFDSYRIWFNAAASYEAQLHPPETCSRPIVRHLFVILIE